MGENSVIIQLENIVFSYAGGKRVLDDLCFSLEEGAKLGLIGHNGSGKTTMLHIIMGLLKPSSGTIRAFGKPIETKKDFLDVRRKIGFLFQDADDQLFCPTVLEDIAFGPLNTGSLAPSRFHIDNENGDARIIELVAGEILTRSTLDRVKSEKDGVVADIERDILKLAVIERHKGTGRMGMGLVRGFGLQGGAIASSVAHDSHNVIVVGTNDRDMCHAAETLRDMGGGMVAVRSETILAKVPLQVAGLMSVEPVDVLVKQLNTLEQEVASLGCSISDPFMRLSFLALPVIPQLRLTDRGLVDVDAFDFVPLFVQDR